MRAEPGQAERQRHASRAPAPPSSCDSAATPSVTPARPPGSRRRRWRSPRASAPDRQHGDRARKRRAARRRNQRRATRRHHGLLQPHAAAAAAAGRAFADQLDAGRVERGDRASSANRRCRGSRRRSPPCAGWSAPTARELGQRALVDAEQRPRGAELRAGNHGLKHQNLRPECRILRISYLNGQFNPLPGPGGLVHNCRCSRCDEMHSNESPRGCFSPGASSAPCCVIVACCGTPTVRTVPKL